MFNEVSLEDQMDTNVFVMNWDNDSLGFFDAYSIAAKLLHSLLIRKHINI